MQTSPSVIPFPDCKQRRVFTAMADGNLSPDAVAEIESLQASQNHEAEVVLVATVGVLEYFVRVALTDPECVREAAADGLSPLGGLELEFSIRVSLEDIDSRASALDEADVIEWLDLLNALSFRSVRRIQKKQLADLHESVRPDNWMPPIYDMFAPEENEIVSGAWMFLNADEVRVWFRGLVRWSEKLLPLVGRASRLLLRKWDLERSVHTSRQLH